MYIFSRLYLVDYILLRFCLAVHSTTALYSFWNSEDFSLLKKIACFLASMWIGWTSLFYQLPKINFLERFKILLGFDLFMYFIHRFLIWVKVVRMSSVSVLLTRQAKANQARSQNPNLSRLNSVSILIKVYHAY